MDRIIRLGKEHYVKHSRDETGETIFDGKRGIICRGDRRGELHAVLLSPGVKSGRVKEGMKQDPALRLILEGDVEAIFAFPEDALRHVAQRWIKCRMKRMMSEENKKAAAERIKAYRKRA